MTTQELGEVLEIGKIRDAGNRIGVVVNLDDHGETFFPLSVLKVQSLAERGFLYTRVRVTIAFETAKGEAEK